MKRFDALDAVQSSQFDDMAYTRPRNSIADLWGLPSGVRKCDACGFEYAPGNREDRSLHRSVHSKAAQAFSLKPVQALQRRAVHQVDGIYGCRLAYPDRDPVVSRRLERIAIMLKREFRHGSAQWCHRGDPMADTVGYLLCTRRGVQIGGMAFRYRRYVYKLEGWAMQWVWIQPAFRRHGVMSALWSVLEADVGPFHVETPLSDEMTAFLARLGRPAYLLDRHDTGQDRHVQEAIIR